MGATRRRRGPPFAAKLPGSRLRWLMLDRFVRRTKTLSQISIACTGKPIELSSACTRSPAQKLDRFVQSTEPPALFLDRFAHLTKGDGREVVRDEVADGTLSNISFTCTGNPIAVSLRVDEPPAVSRLYLHWPEGFRPEMQQLNKPSVIAAHGLSILFETYVPLPDICDPTYYPSDYFVYTALSGSERSPVLRRLPTCFIGGLVDPFVDQYYNPHRLQQQRPMFRSDVGLLCHGEDKFTVAELLVEDLMGNNELCVLHHTPAEKYMKWKLMKLPVPCSDGSPIVLHGSWETDTVIAFGDRYLCWVDFYHGLLFVDVIAKCPQPPCYVQLPACLLQHRLYIDIGSPDPARHVSVTETGMIKLICIRNDAGHSEFDRSCSAFTITTWTLLNFKNSEWKQDASMNAKEFWAALAVDKRLPCVRPVFPIMSLVHPDVICFTVEDSCGISWLIEVNMKKKVLGAVTLYISEEEEEGGPAAMFRRNIFYGNSFIGSQITQYMNQDAIKSIVMSKKLQETKLQRAMEKCLH